MLRHFQNENGSRTGAESQDKAKRGYARLGYGNYGNLDARANYLFILPNSDKLNLNFHMNGMDGKLDLPDSKDKWDARYYRTHAGMDYVHAFRKMDLNVAGNFGLSNFNFMPGSTNNKQKFLSGDVHFGIKSTSEELPLQFHAETNLMFYERQHDIQYQDAQEVMVRTKAGAMGTISEEQFRNAKSTTLVFASLFFGLSLFLVVTGLLHGLSPENYVSQWGVSDFALTYSIHEREDLISSEMVSEIGQLDGIENLRLTYAPYPQVAADVVYDDAVFHEFLASLDGVNGIDFSDPAKLENYQQNFFSGVFGIDSAYLEEINAVYSV